jgi:hypothetical protein
VTLDRSDLARRLTVVPYPRRIPAVLSVEEVTLLLRAATSAHRFPAGSFFGGFPMPAPILGGQSLAPGRHPKPYPI